MTGEEMRRIGVAGLLVEALNAYEEQVGIVRPTNASIVLLDGTLWRNVDGEWWYEPLRAIPGDPDHGPIHLD